MNRIRIFSDSSVEKLRRLFRQQEFLILFFFFCLVFYNGYFLSAYSRVNPYSAFIYLYFVWAVIIALLFLISRSLLSSLQIPDRNPEEKRKDV